ncbi:MAG: beta-galactosidase [Armatimonadota bacterium]|nr:beta-galactosidase [Armatimonadota bacterium]
MLTSLLSLTAAAILSSATEPYSYIGPTRIPFYTGNLSVTPFMRYWGTASTQGDDWASPERIRLLKRISCVADCDYQSWALAEPERERWDFSLYIKNADALHEAGFKYVVFCWVHFPPRWFLNSPEFVPYRCAEHGEELMQLSPWAPNIWDIYRRFYRAQYKAMGDKIDWVRVAVPSDYGEIGYPAAMTSWIVPQKHAHPGYWCGDPYARADFRADMQARFRKLDVLNKRWGTSFQAWEDITFPDLRDEKAAQIARESGKPTDRRRWLDFVDWYYGEWLEFTPKLASLIREFYPDKPLIVSVGYASEVTKFGNDYSAIPKMARRHNLAVQAPSNVSYYAVKRISTACRFYGCPFYTEPPGDVPPEAEVARVFTDASSGVQTYFEYPQNLERAVAQLRKYKDHLTGAQPEVELAIFNPTIEHRLYCGRGNFPLNAYMLAERGRDLFDYDVVDEFLIRDGALSKYRVLIYVQGSVTEEFALRRIADWVKSGGTLVTCNMGPVETVEGDRSIWESLVPVGTANSEQVQTRQIGRGLIVVLPFKPEEHEQLAQEVAKAIYNLSRFESGQRDICLIDGESDNVFATLLPDRILYFNCSDHPVVKRIRLRPRDWSGRPAVPEKMDYELNLAPHSIEALLLRPAAGR